MITILILGLVLFIVGVGATYAHDHYKEYIAGYNSRKQEAATRYAAAVQASAQAKAALTKANADAKAMVAKMRQQVLATTQPATMRPPPLRPSSAGQGSTPTKKTNMSKLTQQDSMSLEELIQHIESLKKK